MFVHRKLDAAFYQIQTKKAIKKSNFYYFCSFLVFLLYKAVLIFKTVDDILNWDHS